MHLPVTDINGQVHGLWMQLTAASLPATQRCVSPLFFVSQALVTQNMAAPSVSVVGPSHQGFESILTPEALKFVGLLEQKFGGERKRLLALRTERQRRIDAGERPDFLAETAGVRQGTWNAAPIPQDLQDRRVEITGPVDRKMVINALNSGANCFMADFEDSLTPTWFNLIDGQINLRDAIRRTISYTDTKTKKEYRLNAKTAVLLARPRGWHLPENHVLVDGQPMSGSLFDFGMYFFHNARETLSRNSGTYFYLPKMESHLEARLWEQVFDFAEQYLSVPRGTIRATVLIETILGAFEMEEIIYELRAHRRPELRPLTTSSATSKVLGRSALCGA